jgi:hypothetical protein
VIGQIPFHTALLHTVLLQTVLPQMSLLQIHIPDVGTLLEALGPWVLAGIAVIVFIESGVLFPFLPGDSLLVTAAILAPQLHVSRWLIWAVAFVAAVAGDQVGYWLGRRFGRRLFKPDARVLKTEYLNRAEEFFDHYGSPVAGARPIRPDRADLCAAVGRDSGDALPPLPDLERPGRPVVDGPDGAAGHPLRQYPDRRQSH